MTMTWRSFSIFDFRSPKEGYRRYRQNLYFLVLFNLIFNFLFYPFIKCLSISHTSEMRENKSQNPKKITFNFFFAKAFGSFTRTAREWRLGRRFSPSPSRCRWSWWGSRCWSKPRTWWRLKASCDLLLPPLRLASHLPPLGKALTHSHFTPPSSLSHSLSLALLSDSSTSPSAISLTYSIPFHSFFPCFCVIVGECEEVRWVYVSK